jgi:hypothetical protein
MTQMTQRPNRVFVPRARALGHLGHVVYVDPNDPSALGWYPVGTRLVPGWYPMTQMTQAHQVVNP